MARLRRAYLRSSAHPCGTGGARWTCSLPLRGPHSSAHCRTRGRRSWSRRPPCHQRGPLPGPPLLALAEREGRERCRRLRVLLRLHGTADDHESCSLGEVREEHGEHTGGLLDCVAMEARVGVVLFDLGADWVAGYAPIEQRTLRVAQFVPEAALALEAADGVARRCGGFHRQAFSHGDAIAFVGSEEHTSELQSRQYLVCRLLLA